MKITYIERGKPFDFKRIDTVKTVKVKYLAFSQGELNYYKVNDFEYFVIDQTAIIKTEE